MAVDEPYRGFEQGPIRPPSERDSLLVRVTRNCPWNRCTFCGLYKGERFSRRPVTHVLQDIDAVVGKIDADFGGIDILVNNAAIFDMAPIQAITEESYARVFDVNLKGPLFTMKAVAKW